MAVPGHLIEPPLSTMDTHVNTMTDGRKTHGGSLRVRSYALLDPLHVLEYYVTNMAAVWR